MSFTIIVAPFWSAITDAYTQKDILWIKKSMKSLMKLSLLFGALTIILILFSNSFYLLWVGDKVEVPFMLSLFMGFYVVMRVFGQPFNHFVNGTGKIKAITWCN